MKFFRRVGSIDPAPLLAELSAHPQLWGAVPVRTADPASPHREATDILLRFSDLALPRTFLEHAASIDRVDYPALDLFRSVSWLFAEALPTGMLGSILVARLAPGACIHPHSDRIEAAERLFPSGVVPALWFDRYQFVLQGEQRFTCGDDVVTMVAGEVWWFDNAAEHSVVNTGAVDRIALIADVHSSDPMPRVQERLAT